MIREGTILVVDDTRESRELITDILVAEGYKVRSADSGKLALDLAAAIPPKLILLDILMPGMDGFEVLRHLKAQENTCDIPVIILSGITEVEHRVKGLEMGAADFISKPFRSNELLARVRTHMELFCLRVQLEQRAADLRMANEQLQIDITERKKVEEALRESEERYRNLFVCSPSGLFRIDLRGSILDANPALVHILGYTDIDAVRAINFFNLCRDPIDAQRMQNLLETRGIVEQMEFCLTHPQKELIWANMTILPVVDVSGNIVVYDGFIYDISENKTISTLLSDASGCFDDL